MITTLRNAVLQTKLRELYQEPPWTDRLSGLGELGAYTQYASYIAAPASSSSDGWFSSDTSSSLTDTSQGGSLTASDLTAGFQPSSISASVPPIGTSEYNISQTTSNPFTSILTALGIGAANAAGQIAAGAITGVALQQTNAQRLAQGLPPLTANGTVMTAAQMAAAGYNATQISAVQSQLGIEPQTLMILAAIGIGAFLLLSGKKD